MKMSADGHDFKKSNDHFTNDYNLRKKSLTHFRSENYESFEGAFVKKSKVCSNQYIEVAKKFIQTHKEPQILTGVNMETTSCQNFGKEYDLPNFAKACEEHNKFLNSNLHSFNLLINERMSNTYKNYLQNVGGCSSEHAMSQNADEVIHKISKINSHKNLKYEIKTLFRNTFNNDSHVLCSEKMEQIRKYSCLEAFDECSATDIGKESNLNVCRLFQKDSFPKRSCPSSISLPDMETNKRFCDFCSSCRCIKNLCKYQEILPKCLGGIQTYSQICRYLHVASTCYYQEQTNDKCLVNKSKRIAPNPSLCSKVLMFMRWHDELWCLRGKKNTELSPMMELKCEKEANPILETESETALNLYKKMCGKKHRQELFNVKKAHKEIGKRITCQELSVQAIPLVDHLKKGVIYLNNYSNSKEINEIYCDRYLVITPDTDSFEKMNTIKILNLYKQMRETMCQCRSPSSIGFPKPQIPTSLAKGLDFHYCHLFFTPDNNDQMGTKLDDKTPSSFARVVPPIFNTNFTNAKETIFKKMEILRSCFNHRDYQIYSVHVAYTDPDLNRQNNFNRFLERISEQAKRKSRRSVLYSTTRLRNFKEDESERNNRKHRSNLPMCNICCKPKKPQFLQESVNIDLVKMKRGGTDFEQEQMKKKIELKCSKKKVKSSGLEELATNDVTDALIIKKSMNRNNGDSEKDNENQHEICVKMSGDISNRIGKNTERASKMEGANNIILATNNKNSLAKQSLNDATELNKEIDEEPTMKIDNRMSLKNDVKMGARKAKDFVNDMCTTSKKRKCCKCKKKCKCKEKNYIENDEIMKKIDAKIAEIRKKRPLCATGTCSCSYAEELLRISVPASCRQSRLWRKCRKEPVKVEPYMNLEDVTELFRKKKRVCDHNVTFGADGDQEHLNKHRRSNRDCEMLKAPKCTCTIAKEILKKSFPKCVCKERLGDLRPEEPVHTPPVEITGAEYGETGDIPPGGLPGAGYGETGYIPPDGILDDKPAESGYTTPSGIASAKPEEPGLIPQVEKPGDKPEEPGLIPSEGTPGAKPGEPVLIPPGGISGAKPEEPGYKPPGGIPGAKPEEPVHIPPGGIPGAKPAEPGHIPSGGTPGAKPPGEIAGAKPGEPQYIPPGGLPGAKPAELGKQPPGGIADVKPGDTGEKPGAVSKEPESIPSVGIPSAKTRKSESTPPSGRPGSKSEEPGIIPQGKKPSAKPGELGKQPPAGIADSKSGDGGEKPGAVSVEPESKPSGGVPVAKTRKSESAPQSGIPSGKPEEPGLKPQGEKPGAKPGELGKKPPTAITDAKPGDGGEKPGALSTEPEPKPSGGVPGAKTGKSDSTPPSGISSGKPEEPGLKPQGEKPGAKPGELGKKPPGEMADARPEDSGEKSGPMSIEPKSKPSGSIPQGGQESVKAGAKDGESDAKAKDPGGKPGAKPGGPGSTPSGGVSNVKVAGGPGGAGKTKKRSPDEMLGGKGEKSGKRGGPFKEVDGSPESGKHKSNRTKPKRPDIGFTAKKLRRRCSLEKQVKTKCCIALTNSEHMLYYLTPLTRKIPENCTKYAESKFSKSPFACVCQQNPDLAPRKQRRIQKKSPVKTCLESLGYSFR